MTFPAEPLIGNSPAIEKVRQLIAALAPSSLPVLIEGESGTGKEVVARQIHLQSTRSNKPFVVVDCAALTTTLMETELFGYSRGAFTGADKQHLGLLNAANGGTLFLDEVGELPLLAQSRLLRVVQEREFRPVGATKNVPVDTRIVAATNRDLEREMATGRFRPDLYFRLNVINLRIPPLRERRTDVAQLVEHFLTRFNSTSDVCFDEATIFSMVNYEWPGNVRELRNYIEQALALGSAASLPSELLPGISASPSLEGVLPLSALEHQGIQRALIAAGGHRIRAAKLLGIGKTTLYRKLKQMNLAG